MVKYDKFLYDDKFDAKKKETKTARTSLQYQYIWKTQPRRKDITTKHSLSKSIFLIVVGFLFMLGTYLLSHNAYLAIGITIILEVSFCLIFYDAFFFLRGKSTFHPFKDIVFWQLKGDKSTLYYTNYNDLFTVGMKLFSIEVLAQSVHPSIIHFVKAFLDIEEYIPFSYQVVHTKKQSGALKTYIYLTIFSATQGKVNRRKIGYINNQLFEYGIKINSLFASDYHHFQVNPLKGNSLIGGIRSSLLQENFEDTPSKDVPMHTFNIRSTVMRTAFVSLLLIAFNVYFGLLLFPILFIVIFNLIFIPALLLIWWQNILFQLFSVKFFHYQEIQVIDPFHNVKFYLFHQIPDIIFAHVENKEVIGIKMYNVNKVLKPPFGSFSKFYSGVNHYLLPFTYTVVSRPLSFAELDKGYSKDFREKARQYMVGRLLNDEDRFGWLDKRAGIWETMFSLSTTYRIPAHHVSAECVSIITKQLYKAGTVLVRNFGSNFKRFRLIKLHKHLLELGLQCEILKNTHIYANGSHLWLGVYQGTALMSMITVPDEIKKGMKVQIAAEFNTPLYLENFIEIGHTLNTETLRTEVPAGFLLSQLHSLLITNGTTHNRELLNMKMAIELIKKGIPCLIFDFTGKWSKLLTYFEPSKYQQNIVHFKLGKAFTLDPFTSGIPYENDNIRYLEYMFDAYAMSFKKDDRFMHSFKNSIRQFGANLNVAKIALQHKPEYEKNATVEGLLSTLSDISQEDLAFLQTTDEEVVKVHEFITTPHTVIIDLSISTDYKTLCYLMFLVLSKLIRYCTSSTRFVSKFIFLPHIDIMFENKYLEKMANYGMIDKFLDALQEKDFGLICSANEIRHLHSNVFKFLSNLATFRTTDSRDIATLSNLLNLNELHGTGYYSSKRNENYQVQFLRNMKHNQILIKRSDIDQTFPVVLQVEKVKNAHVMDYHDIVHYMDTQGYDLKFTEKRILSLAQKSKFDRDLGEYVEYKSELIQFFDKIKTVQNVAGLYEKKVKKLLLEYLYPKLSQHYPHSNKEIAQIRDTIYGILRKHEYLVEDHPRSAGGGQSTRTCLIVGPAYEKAIREDFSTKKNIPPHIAVDVINQETPGVTRFLQSKLSSQTEQQLKDVLAHNFDGKMVRALFKIEYSIRNKEHATSLKMLHVFVPSYIKKCCAYYYHSEEGTSPQEVREFITLISDLQGFPFHGEEVMNLFERCEHIDMSVEDGEQLSQEIYNLVYKWYIKLKKFLNR